jgi:hypothetical protein
VTRSRKRQGTKEPESKPAEDRNHSHKIELQFLKNKPKEKGRTNIKAEQQKGEGATTKSEERTQNLKRE